MVGDAKVNVVKALRELSRAGCLSEQESDRLSYFILSEVFSMATIKHMAEDLLRDAQTCIASDTVAFSKAINLLREAIRNE